LVAFDIADGANLKVWSRQDLKKDVYFFNHTYVNLARDAQFKNFDALLGAKVAKTKILADLNGKGSYAELNGVYFTTGKQHSDVVTVQRHFSSNAQSRSFYKGVIRDRARSIYQGLIEVKEGARDTDAYLTNKNLLLNDGARSDSIPKLKIDNNDVRCSHGSTSGKIDPSQLFYLKSRGIPEPEARQLIVEGFLEELYDEAPAAFASDLKRRIEGKAGKGE
jgi:Fe-S cluster assembly protein SufD